jgi:hypothetical protein
MLLRVYVVKGGQYLLELEEVEYFTFLRLNICFDFHGMIFTLDVACLWQQQCAVMINLFISFTDSHSILIVGQWI